MYIYTQKDMCTFIYVYTYMYMYNWGGVVDIYAKRCT